MFDKFCKVMKRRKFPEQVIVPQRIIDERNIAQARAVRRFRRENVFIPERQA